MTFWNSSLSSIARDLIMTGRLGFVILDLVTMETGGVGLVATATVRGLSRSLLDITTHLLLLFMSSRILGDLTRSGKSGRDLS